EVLHVQDVGAVAQEELELEDAAERSGVGGAVQRGALAGRDHDVHRNGRVAVGDADGVAEGQIVHAGAALDGQRGALEGGGRVVLRGQRGGEGGENEERTAQLRTHDRAPP